MNISNLPGLQIASSFIEADSPNFRPNCWPPSSNFPVVVDTDGSVISRYGDARWDFSVWQGSNLKIYFGDGQGQGHKLSQDNANLLRQIVAWWLWGYAAVTNPRSLVSKFATIKPIFVICSQHNISASQLSDFPDIIKEIASNPTIKEKHLITYLNDLMFISKEIGFNILDEKGMSIFVSAVVKRDKIQTAYIPTRLWHYQVKRLKECLDDFIAHKDKIEECYKFCLEAYANNAGGKLSHAFNGLSEKSPFNSARYIGKRPSGQIFYGSFANTAKTFEIDTLLKKWGNADEVFGIGTLSSYMSLISFVGLAYTLNFSLMRVEECNRLRADCFEVEVDPLGTEIYLIRGATTKTLEDNNARWIVSPSVKIAIDAMVSIASLRMLAAQEDPHTNLPKEFIDNPVLQCTSHEPWIPKNPSQIKNLFRNARKYSEALKIWPKLFDENELRITEKDLEMANRLTSGLDPEKYSVGKVWPLAWHQLRRTGAVNMLASGLVSEFSVQYQLKHASRAMSQYYGQNYYKLKEPLNDEARSFYLREMYESIVRDLKELQADHYVSPHTEKRKEQLLSEISEKDHKQLLAAAKSGKVSYRETFLGGCANLGPPCPLGGISNISSCMGFGDEKPCKSALIDKEKLPMINQLKDVLSSQIKGVEIGTPLYESLQAQLESAERAIHVIHRS